MEGRTISECEGVEWFHLAQDMVRFWYIMNAVMKPAYLRKWEKFSWLGRRRTSDFNRCDYRAAQMKHTVLYGSARTGD
jgi:hypothetical protein